MVLTRTHGIDKDLWYRQGLMVLTTPMVFTKAHGIESILLNHTRTTGPSVTCMRDFCTTNSTPVELSMYNHSMSFRKFFQNFFSSLIFFVLLYLTLELESNYLEEVANYHIETF